MGIILVPCQIYAQTQYCLRFDGDDDYVYFGEPTELDVENITIELWAKLDILKPGVIFAKPGAYYLRLNDDYCIDAGIYNSNDANWQSVTGTTVLDANIFYHLAFTYDSTVLKIYLNGILEDSTNYAGIINPFLTNGIYAGNQFFIDDYADYTNSVLDTMIYVHENYSNHIPETAGQEIDVANNRYHFFGDNDVDDVGDEAISYLKGFSALDYTIEVEQSWSQQEGNTYISPRFNSVQDKYEIALDPEWDALLLSKVVNNVWSNIFILWIGGSNPINNNQWYTVKTNITTLTSTSRIQSWINGTPYIDETDPDLDYTGLAILTYDGDYEDFSYDIYFRNLTVNIPFDGEMDEMRIWDVALTSSQINQMKNIEIDQNYVDNSVPGVSWSNLAAYYQFNETSGTNLSDASSNSNDGTLYNFSVPSCWVPSDAPLPVELTSFTCTVNNRDVKLNWSTAGELNNAGFEVERKPAGDGAMWTKIGFVQGNGTTNEPKNYSFEDKKLNTGKYDYRLRQLDYNNQETVFNLNNSVEVGIPNKSDLSQNYPNPFNPITKIDYNITYNSKVTLKIFDITGREISTLVNETKEAGYYTVQFNASEYASGTYFYRLTTEESGKENFVMTKRMILIK